MDTVGRNANRNFLRLTLKFHRPGPALEARDKVQDEKNRYFDPDWP